MNVITSYFLNTAWWICAMNTEISTGKNIKSHVSLDSTTLKSICVVHQLFCRAFPTRIRKYFTNLDQLFLLWMIWANISLWMREIIGWWKWAEVKEGSSGTDRESLFSFPLRMRVHWHRAAAQQLRASARICCRHQQPLTTLTNQFLPW